MQISPTTTQKSQTSSMEEYRNHIEHIALAMDTLNQLHKLLVERLNELHAKMEGLETRERILN